MVIGNAFRKYKDVYNIVKGLYKEDETDIHLLVKICHALYNVFYMYRNIWSPIKPLGLVYYLDTFEIDKNNSELYTCFLHDLVNKNKDFDTVKIADMYATKQFVDGKETHRLYRYSFNSQYAYSIISKEIATELQYKNLDPDLIDCTKEVKNVMLQLKSLEDENGRIVVSKDSNMIRKLFLFNMVEYPSKLLSLDEDLCIEFKNYVENISRR